MLRMAASAYAIPVSFLLRRTANTRAKTRALTFEGRLLLTMSSATTWSYACTIASCKESISTRNPRKYSMEATFEGDVSSDSIGSSA